MISVMVPDLFGSYSVRIGDLVLVRLGVQFGPDFAHVYVEFLLLLQIVYLGVGAYIGQFGQGGASLLRGRAAHTGHPI